MVGRKASELSAPALSPEPGRGKARPAGTVPGASRLEAHLGYWLRFVSNHVSHAFARRLVDRGVTAAEWVVLRELFDRPPTAPSLVAERLGMSRGAISRLAERLASKSLLLREAAGGDRRFQALALSAEGRALVPELAALADANDEAFFGHLSAAERSVIEEALRGIVVRHRLKAVPVD